MHVSITPRRPIFDNRSVHVDREAPEHDSVQYGTSLQSVSLILRSMLINLSTIDPRNILK